MNQNAKKIGIVGYGEIGSSLEKCYLGKNFDVRVRDIVRDDGLENCNILNICIPYKDESFIDIVSYYIKNLNPGLTIIHSTVIPGTTLKIIEKTGNNNIVHSPVRGVHPKLYEGLKTFVKYIGSETFQPAVEASKHFNELGILNEVILSTKSTELAKILCTTYYGLCIAWHDEVNRICKKQDVLFENVMTKWNTTYNDGYEKLGMKHVNRPVLYPPVDSKIGGHCVIPNAELCKTFFESTVLDYILERK